MLTWLFLSFCGTFRLGLTTLSPDRRASSCQSGTGAPGCSPRRSLPWPSRLPEIQKLDINKVNASMTYLNWWKPMETYGNCHDLSIFSIEDFQETDRLWGSTPKWPAWFHGYTVYIYILCWVAINYDLQSSSRAMNTKLLSDLLRHQTTQQ